MLEHAFGRAADQQVIHRAVAVYAHHNQVGVNGARLIQNLLCHRAGRLVSRDLNTVLQDLFLPASQL